MSIKTDGPIQTQVPSIRQPSMETKDQHTVKVIFTTKVPMTDRKVERIARDIVNVEKTYEIVKGLKVNNKIGLNRGPATDMINKIKTFSSNFVFEKDGEVIDHTSITAVLNKCMIKGTRIQLKASGTDSEVVAKEIDELLKLNEKGERLFHEDKITIDASKAVDVESKLNMIDEKIKAEMNIFMNLIAPTVEHRSMNGGLSESEFMEIAKQFGALANIKGIRNDILKMFKNTSFLPETTLEVYVKDSGTVFQIIGKDGVARTINVRNANENLIAQFNHVQISRPIKEFNEDLLRLHDIVSLLNDSHVYEIKRTQNKLEEYYESLWNFLTSPINKFKLTFRNALKRRIQYEHHKFIGIKHYNIEPVQPA